MLAAAKRRAGEERGAVLPSAPTCQGSIRQLEMRESARHSHGREACPWYLNRQRSFPTCLPVDSVTHRALEGGCGPGKDQLTGGPGGDGFIYAALSDSGITAATRDLVADFEQGIDGIVLQIIDANTTNAAGTNDAFNFIGTNTPFTGSAGQLHAFWTAIGQMVEGDVNGDAKADFSIEIKDPTHAITLTGASFNL
jgi:hypothetical protein